MLGSLANMRCLHSFDTASFVIMHGNCTSVFSSVILQILLVNVLGHDGLAPNKPSPLPTATKTKTKTKKKMMINNHIWDGSFRRQI
uniref:Uncharacterized protein n=1 Tax=Daucus carota subsp. sativus TaxID=79200 RepID=A0A175YCY2_DAUCS